jgi:hypothetical protein
MHFKFRNSLLAPQRYCCETGFSRSWQPTNWKIIFILLATFISPIILHAEIIDSTAPKPKPIGSVLRTVRQIDMTNDTIPETLQIETMKGKRLGKNKVRFSIYGGKKLLYEHSWKVDDFFDPRDKLSDTIKWFRLQRILRVFFSNQNFSMSDSEGIALLPAPDRPGEIRSGSEEEKEFLSSPHKIFSIFAGRDDLYAITWLQSKKKFVIVWRS